MSVRARVVQVWQRLTRRQRQVLRDKSIRSGDGVSRLRCKVIMALVQGKAPSRIASGGLCASSQVDRTACLFLEGGLPGMADTREDNGEPKVDARCASELLTIVAGSPQGYGDL